MHDKVQLSTHARAEDVEQEAIRRSVAAQFPIVDAFLSSAGARPMAPQVSQADEALSRVRAENRTHRIRVLDAPGATLTVTCPAWCESDHEDEVERGTFLEDFTHCGAFRSAEFDDGTNTSVEIMGSAIMQRPFARNEHVPVASVQVVVGGTGDFECDPAQLATLAHALDEHADQLRSLARNLAVIRGGAR
ncbi:hypothetical protein OKJ48_39365 [Streptomyces kunmingensis]|uniref:GAF domain-containing protein n=1 Tax=Streptomyces kunmingensis TaxID=68225 RepID=A0ABU6CNI3_9ACTN|nr:hypothetical protein [Streptomyces kunmingensis]MEB3966243.1 hypothetical protein [Streptomyces kunmingensis]